jgi:hypothetical protein
MSRPVLVDYPDRDTVIPSLSEALPKEIKRVRALPRRDAHARFAVKYAERAIAEGSVVKMLNALNNLKAHK